ncbi:MAG: alpha/beta fold hydrolase [Planctomycetaceae bacterium]|nr:alpha/beta fold hydrolase [Planctomycetaceae bacterium]
MTEGVIRSFTASDGYTLHYRHWPATARSGGEQPSPDDFPGTPHILIGLHGIQSHSGWYTWSSEKLAAAGFEVYFADRRGSGQNADDRGHADHGLRLINDVRQLIDLARREHSEQIARVTVMAVSWGGKVGAALAALFPDEIDQLALLYPGMEPLICPTRVQTLKLNVARDFDIRRKMVPVPLSDPTLFTDSPRWQEWIRHDPLALHKVTSGFLNAGRDLDHIRRQKSDQIRHRVLVMLAGRDQIIDNHRTRAALHRFASEDIRVIEYPRARHTLEFDSHRERFVDDLIHWLSHTDETTSSHTICGDH